MRLVNDVRSSSIQRIALWTQSVVAQVHGVLKVGALKHPRQWSTPSETFCSRPKLASPNSIIRLSLLDRTGGERGNLFCLGVKACFLILNCLEGGGGGIPTPDTLSGLGAFEGGRF